LLSLYQAFGKMELHIFMGASLINRDYIPGTLNGFNSSSAENDFILRGIPKCSSLNRMCQMPLLDLPITNFAQQVPQCRMSKFL